MYLLQKKIYRLFITLLFTLFSSITHAIVAGGMISNSYHWTSMPVTGFDSIEVPLMINQEPGANGYTFWAHQFSFQNGDIGYFGLQQRENNDKYLNFSIWKTSSWQNHYPAYCRTFSHEGEGVQCDLPYPWQEGVKYLFKVQKNNDRSVSAFITDTQSMKTIEIARIDTPASWGGIDSMSGFVENYYQTNNGYHRCTEVPSTISTTFMATANASIQSSNQTAYTYGNCEKIAQSICSSNNQQCIALINIKPQY